MQYNKKNLMGTLWLKGNAKCTSFGSVSSGHSIPSFFLVCNAAKTFYVLRGNTRPPTRFIRQPLSLGTEWKSALHHMDSFKNYIWQYKSKTRYLNRCWGSCIMILVMSRETCEFEFDVTVNDTDPAFLGNF